MTVKNCLIVDDSDVIRRVLTRMLGALQFHITEAANGLEAVQCCRNSMPDLILLDWSMPDVSGIETLQSLRRLPGGETPIVLYCTTENDPADITRARSAGAFDVLLKPFDRQAVRTKLELAGLL
jgi:two-component system, chemotaxis family, chemotaxis protein CheY